jgi:hypothetical protein
MAAQPLDFTPGPIDRPRRVGAIRRALPPDLRQRSQSALDDAAPEDLFALVAQRAAVAQTAGDPGAEAAAGGVRAGTAAAYQIGDVFPALSGVL